MASLDRIYRRVSTTEARDLAGDVVAGLFGEIFATGRLTRSPLGVEPGRIVLPSLALEVLGDTGSPEPSETAHNATIPAGSRFALVGLPEFGTGVVGRPMVFDGTSRADLHLARAGALDDLGVWSGLLDFVYVPAPEVVSGLNVGAKFWCRHLDSRTDAITRDSDDPDVTVVDAARTIEARYDAAFTAGETVIDDAGNQWLLSGINETRRRSTLEIELTRRDYIHAG